MSSKSTSYDVIVLGAGAAGLMCAAVAGQRGRRVLLLEHTDKIGAKILISGGGRCNFTNLDVMPERFVSANPRFCTSALSRYTQTDFIAMIERHGIAFHEKTLGQLFCDGSARAVVAMLLAECATGGVDVRCDHQITEVTKAETYRVATSHGEFTAPALVLATGGLSIPKMGATGFSYDLARRLGLRVIETMPGLVPFKVAALNADNTALAGVALEAIATRGPHTFRENILFTHRGLSGPAILQISSYWRHGQSITLDLLPDRDAGAYLGERKRARSKAMPQTVLAELLPGRLAQAMAAAHLPATELANIPDKVLAAFGQLLKAWEVTPEGTEGYAKAEVTTGGIDTAELSQKTMASRRVPGLYAIGEAVDVTGWLGGYNFQWAWSSGWVAGQAV
jgi:predicted Rossmann fold flavoprotein